MRCSRVIAAIVFSSALVFLSIFPASASAVEDNLYCESGVAYFQPMNSSSGKWVDYDPTVNSTEDVFTFSNLPNILTEGNYEYSFNSFTFLLYPYSDYVTFDRGYIYTYNFEIRSTKNTTPDLTGFEFGVCKEGFNDAVPLADVVYTYDKSGATTINYYVTVTLHVDDTFPANSVPYLDDAYLYLQIGTEWSDTFSLRASNMTMRKAVGEDAYYQASLDAIENLPQSEYNFIYNSMPDAEGEIKVIEGELLDVLQAYDAGIQQLVQIMRIEQAKPCVYLPEVSIPILNIDVFNNHVFFVDDYLNTMDASIMPKIELVLVFIRLVFCVTFATFTIYKLARIEWWY